MHFRFLAVTLAVLTFVSALQAQQVSGGPDSDRKASTVFVFTESFGTLAGVSISYSQPDWEDSYNGIRMAPSPRPCAGAKVPPGRSQGLRRPQEVAEALARNVDRVHPHP
jgi:hypothetical protein